MSQVRELHVEVLPDGTVKNVPLEPGFHHRIVVTFPTVFRTHTELLWCEVASPALSPLSPEASPLAGLAVAVAKAEELSGRLVVLGHASNTGPAQGNIDLADARARSSAALLVGDEAQWVDILTAHGSPADLQRWLAHWANTLGWSTDPGRTDGVLDARAVAAVEAFQREYNAAFDQHIKESGIITKETLSAAFQVCREDLAAYLREYGTPKLGEVVPRLPADHVIGCGADFASYDDVARLPESAIEAGQRRVDVVAIPPECRWTAMHGADALIRHTRLETLRPSSNAARAHEIWIRLVDHHGRPLPGEAYMLRSAGEERHGVSGPDGLVVERDIVGEHLTMVLSDAAVVVFDDVYRQTVADRSTARGDPVAEPDETDEYIEDGTVSVGDDDVNADLGWEDDDDDAYDEFEPDDGGLS